MDNTLEAIYQSGLKFLSPLSLPDTYRQIVEEGIKLTQTDFGSILLLDNKELKKAYASAPVFCKIKPRKRDFMYRALKAREPVILNAKQIFRHHPEIKETKIHSVIILPLSDRIKPIGVISFMSLKNKFFSEKEKDMLKLFAPLVVLTIRKAQLQFQAQKAMETRDLFISMAAHELKTPLTTINGYTQLLYSKLAETNTPESRWIEELSWESYRLGQLVNELLEIDRIRTGKFRYVWEECYLKEIVDKALLDFRFIRPHNKILMENKLMPGHDRIIGDYNKLLQTILNLLDNAAKFSPLDKSIVISLKHKSGYVICQVKDQGKGISKKDLPRVCQMFYRGGNHSGEGMGVGLFLAKNIVAQHRGIINIRSKENKGTTVEVKLPKLKLLNPNL
ncbi:MAG: GAF domain-containing sensor histidine kinase [Patescibacteria group bacterium]|nr:GAF domain-containing sensor histidine kinase [Patescibacteria group bacterium]